MSRQDEKVVRPFEYCLERSRLALKDELIPELRQEIIHSELSPDKAWREAKRRLQKLRTTVELNKEDEGLSRSYWWLAKTKRDHRERLEKWIEQEEREMGEKKVRISFLGEIAEFDYASAFRLCNEVLDGMIESDAIDDFKNLSLNTLGGALRDHLRESLILTLEKFGYKCIAPKEVSEKENTFICRRYLCSGFLRKVGNVYKCSVCESEYSVGKDGYPAQPTLMRL